MQPSVGRIVHYVIDGKCQAAIITGLVRDSSRINLTVFPTSAGPYPEGCVGEREYKSGPDGAEEWIDYTWHRIEGCSS